VGVRGIVCIIRVRYTPVVIIGRISLVALHICDGSCIHRERVCTGEERHDY